MRSGDEFDAADYLEYAGEVGKLAYWGNKKNLTQSRVKKF
jgi:hypothetical protein